MSLGTIHPNLYKSDAELISDLTVLDNIERMKILDFLRKKKGTDTSFKEICDKFSHTDRRILVMHLRLLNISNLIRNHGIDEDAAFSITSKGEELLTTLESSPEALIISKI